MRKLTLALCTFAFVLAGCEKKVEAPAKPPPVAAQPKPAEPAAPVPEKKPEVPTMTFTKKTVATGVKYEQKEAMDTKMSISMDMGKGPSKMDVTKRENTVKDVEIVEATEAAPTKIKVNFKEETEAETDLKGKEKVKKGPLNGKTYVVSLKGDKVVVNNEKGKPAPKKEADLVAIKFAEFAKPDPVTAAMPSRALKLGEEVPELVDAIKKELSKDSDPKSKDKVTIKSASAKLTEDKGEEGIFEVTATMVMNEKPMIMTVEMKGEMRVRKADSRPTLVKMTGPVTIGSTEEKGPKISGSGTMSFEMSDTKL